MCQERSDTICKCFFEDRFTFFDVSFQNMTLHYCSNGSLTLAFAKNKEVFYMSIVYILKVSRGHNVHDQGRGREREKD